MYKVTIHKRPTNEVNRLVHLLTNSKEIISQNDTSVANRDVIENLIKLCFKEEKPNFEIEIETSDETGQFIIVENDIERKYIQFSCDNDTRNGYIMTKVPLGLRMWADDTTPKKKSFDIVLLDVNNSVYNYHNIDARRNVTRGVYSFNDLNIFNLQSSQIVTPYNSFAYRVFETAGINIVNKAYLPYDKYIKDTAPKTPKAKESKAHREYVENQHLVNTRFTSIKEFERAKSKLTSENAGNDSSYILISRQNITIVAKTFGNNEYEMISYILCLSVLANKENKKLILVPKEDENGFKNIGKKNLSFIKKLGVRIFSEEEDDTQSPDTLVDEKEDSRDQVAFRRNLLNKFNGTKCACCDCYIPESLVASHIFRICDINKLPIPYKEKHALAVNADNGLWLCSNHDRWFETGLITFDPITGKLVYGQDYLEGRPLDDAELSYIQGMTTKTKIDEEFLTQGTKEFIQLHNDMLRTWNIRKKSNTK